MALSWSKRRKFLYTAVASIIAAVALVSVYIAFFAATPTCFDGKFNDGELGIDCGGTCALFCREQVSAPIVRWARVFETAPHVYTVAAYVQNPNKNITQGAGIRRLPYAFQLLDEKNLLIAERTGFIDIPPVPTIPIVITNIDVGTRVAAKTNFSFGTENFRWERISSMPPLRVQQPNLSSDGAKLTATLSNESIENADNVTIAAVLFDAEGVARAASKSIISRIPRKGSYDVTFTWPVGVSNIARAEITVLPSF